MECGDQVLRNFLNGLVIHLRGTKENPKNAMDVIKQNQATVKQNITNKSKTEFKPTRGGAEQGGAKPRTDFNPKAAGKPKSNSKKPAPKVQVVEKVKFNNGKNKK